MINNNFFFPIQISFSLINFGFLDMKVEPSSPVRNANPFSRSSSGSSLHAGNHSSSSGHGTLTFFLNKYLILQLISKILT